MIPVERQRTILRVLAEQGTASIADLVTLLDVSHMTVRRDIAALEAQGRVSSVSGGVALPSRLALDDSHATKAELRPGEKRAIARRAAEFVGPGNLVFLDAGTTTLAIAEEIADRADLVVATNDLVIARLLAERSTSELYLAAGQVDRANLSTEGELVADAIGRFNIDVAFLSTPAFDARGTSIASAAKRTVKDAIVDHATTTYLVTDSSKYGRVMAHRSVKLGRFEALITDSGLSEAARDSLAEAGLTVVLVDPAD